MKIRFKSNLRSPHYGKIVVYGLDGRVDKEINLLELVMSYKNMDIKLGEVLENAIVDNSSIPNLNYRITELEKLCDRIEALEAQNETLSQLVVLLDAQIKASQII